MTTAWLGDSMPYKPITFITNEEKIVKNKEYADNKEFTYEDANEWNGSVEGPIIEQKQSKKIEGLS